MAFNKIRILRGDYIGIVDGLPAYRFDFAKPVIPFAYILFENPVMVLGWAPTQESQWQVLPFTKSVLLKDGVSVPHNAYLFSALVGNQYSAAELNNIMGSAYEFGLEASLQVGEYEARVHDILLNPGSYIFMACLEDQSA